MGNRITVGTCYRKTASLAIIHTRGTRALASISCLWRHSCRPVISMRLLDFHRNFFLKLFSKLIVGLRVLLILKAILDKPANLH